MIKLNNSNISKVTLLLCLLCLLYFICIKVIFFHTSFSSFWLIIGAILILIGLNKSKTLYVFSSLPKLVRGGIVVVLSLLFISYLIIQSLIVFNGFHKDTTKPDYAIVLGAGLIGDKISTSLYYRLTAAVEFHNLYPDVKIVVSGGQGPDELLSEAAAMKKFLIEKGIDEDDIIIEDKSTNTYENFLYTKNKLKELDNKEHISLTVITNNFHMFRAKSLSKQLGFKTYGYPGKTHKFLALNFFVREVPAVIKSYLFDK